VTPADVVIFPHNPYSSKIKRYEKRQGTWEAGKLGKGQKQNGKVSKTKQNAFFLKHPLTFEKLWLRERLSLRTDSNEQNTNYQLDLGMPWMDSDSSIF